MPGEDNLSSRFDYLFEPLDVEESVDGTENAKGPADRAEKKDAAPVRMAFAAFVLAILGAVAVIALLLLQQPAQPMEPADHPVESSLSTTAINIPSPAVTIPAPPAATAEDVVPETIQPLPTQEPEPEPAPARQAPASRTPAGGTPKSPATRAPISVAPESRAPFPNQGPRTGDSGGGGLLGGLL